MLENHSHIFYMEQMERLFCYLYSILKAKNQFDLSENQFKYPTRNKTTKRTLLYTPLPYSSIHQSTLYKETSHSTSLIFHEGMEYYKECGISCEAGTILLFLF